MREVIEQVVAPAVNDSGLEHRVFEAGGANDFLCLPFGFVIGGAAMWARAQETEKQNVTHACALCGVHHVSRPLDVHVRVRLFAELSIDSRAVGDGGASRKSFGQPVLVARADREKLRTVKLPNAWVAPVNASGDEYDLVTSHDEPPGQVPAHKSRSASYGNFHSCANPRVCQKAPRKTKPRNAHASEYAMCPTRCSRSNPLST